MAGYPVVVRLAAYSRLSDSWKTVLQVDQSAIASLRCDFLAYRIEDRCAIEIASPGHIQTQISGQTVTLEKARDIIDSYLRRVGVALRLDVYAPDARLQTNNQAHPDNWVSPPIYWSGVVQSIKLERHPEAGKILRISASGWTSYLDRLPVANRWYYNQTIEEIVDDLFNLGGAGIKDRWPGAIAAVKVPGGTAPNLVVERIGWIATSVRKALDDLAQFANFLYGVSVSGYPIDPPASSIPEEFRFIQMAEPFYEYDVATPAPGTPGLGWGSEHVVDINDPRVVEYAQDRDDANHANAWQFNGEPLFADHVSVITGHDADEIRDTHSKTGDISGVFRRLPSGFIGWQIRIIDRAIRIVFRDPETGDRLEAGTLQPVPLSISRKQDGQAIFSIDGYSETAGADGESIFQVNNFPAPKNELNLNITNSALRYTLVPGELSRVVRIVKDEDEVLTATGREDLYRQVDDAFIRGWLQAGLYALADRWAERHERERCTIKLRNWRYFANAGTYLTNVIRVLAGAGRVTRLGTTGAGGDGWKWGDDERACGPGTSYEIRRARLSWTEDGWEVTWELSGTPVDLVRVILPQAVRGRSKERR